MLSVVSTIVSRDVKLYLRRQSDWSIPVIFLIMIVSVFPMALGPSPKTLSIFAPGIIWVAVVLSLLMSLEYVFRSDYQEGVLEQFVLSVYPLPLVLLGKAIAHFLAMGIPMLMLTPIFAFLLHMPLNEIWVLWGTLLLGIPIISLVGSIGAVLTIGLHRGGVLLSVLILPLIIPVIIFGVSSVSTVRQGFSAYPQLLILGALLLLALVFSPLAASIALKVSVE